MLDFLKKPDFRKPKIHHDLFSAWHGQGKGGKKKSKKFFVILSFALILGLAGSFLYPFYRQKALVHADSLIKFDEGNGTSANDTTETIMAPGAPFSTFCTSEYRAGTARPIQMAKA